MARSTSRQGRVNALPGFSVKETRPPALVISTSTASSPVTRPSASPMKRLVDTE
jgi:hypothetical protein